MLMSIMMPVSIPDRRKKNDSAMFTVLKFTKALSIMLTVGLLILSACQI